MAAGALGGCALAWRGAQIKAGNFPQPGSRTPQERGAAGVQRVCQPHPHLRARLCTQVTLNVHRLGSPSLLKNQQCRPAAQQSSPPAQFKSEPLPRKGDCKLSARCVHAQCCLHAQGLAARRSPAGCPSKPGNACQIYKMRCGQGCPLAARPLLQNCRFTGQHCDAPSACSRGADGPRHLAAPRPNTALGA